MSLLDNLQSDLRRALADHRASLLVQVLRHRLKDLTFDDLRQVLNSRMGEGLGARLVGELVTGTDPTHTADVNVATTAAPARKQSAGHKVSTGQAKAATRKAAKKAAKKAGKKAAKKAGKKAAKVKARRAAATPTPPSDAPAKPPKVSALTVAGRERYDSSVVKFLREREGWHASGLVRAHAGGSEVQIRGAMERLEKAGLIERTGNFASTRYRARPLERTDGALSVGGR